MIAKEMFEYFHIYEFDINSNEDTTNLIKSMWEEIEKLNNIIDKQDKEFKFEDRKYYSEYLINKTLGILKGEDTNG